VLYPPPNKPPPLLLLSSFTGIGKSFHIFDGYRKQMWGAVFELVLVQSSPW